LVLLWSTLFGFLRFIPARRPSPTTILLLCWPFFCLVFFSVSKSKLPGYILPAVPTIGLLLARSYVGLSARLEKTFRWQLFAWSSLALPASLCLLWMGRNFSTSRTNAKLWLAIGCVLLFFTAANLCLTIKSRVLTRGLDVAAFCVIPLFAVLILFQALSSPWLRFDPSGKTLAHELTERQVPLEHFYIATMHRGQEFSLDFYLHRELETWDVARPKVGRLLLSTRACNLYVKSPWECTHDPLELGDSGWFVFNVVRQDSMDGLTGLDWGSSGGNPNNRQPR
jgi:hypothetical protein